MLDRVAKLERRLKTVETKLRKLEEKPLTLQEKVHLHDHARRLIDEFEAHVSGLPDDVWVRWKIGDDYTEKPMKIKNVKEVVTRLAELLDYALGIKKNP